MKKSILTKSQVKKYSKHIEIDGKDGRIDVTVRYDDSLGNGHNSFSITGAIYDHPTYKVDKRCLGSGCIHDEIKEYMPELNHLIKWHYMTSVRPMHYIENTLYHARDGEEQDLDAARSCSIWEDATLEQLQSEELLDARLPSLIEEFIEVVEELGFTY